jgi:hypothetical protein
MNGPDQYDMDDKLMDELGGAMDEYDEKKIHPIVIEISIHPQGKPDAPKEDGDEAMPTPEELDELQKAMS